MLSYLNNEKKGNRKSKKKKPAGMRALSVLLSVLLAFSLPLGNGQFSIGETGSDAAAMETSEQLIDESGGTVQRSGGTQQSEPAALTIESIQPETQPNGLLSAAASENGSAGSTSDDEKTEQDIVTVTLFRTGTQGSEKAKKVLKAEAGETLENLLKAQPDVLSDSKTADPKQCFWYTVDAAGHQQEYDPTLPVTEDLTVYYTVMAEETAGETETEVLTEAESESETKSEVLTEAESGSETETEVLTEAGSESETESEMLTEAESGSETETEVLTEAGSESETETEVLTEAGSGSETETEVLTEAGSESETESEMLTEAESESESETEVLTEAGSESETESEMLTEAESESESETEVLTEVESETETESETMAEEETDEMDDRIAPYDALHVEYYAAVNGSWQLVTTKTEVSGQAYFDRQTRYYVTADALEDIYGDYGFEAADLQAGSHLFPHTDTNSRTTLWGDVAATASGSEVRVPLAMRTTMYVYYLPHNVSGYSSYFTSSKSITDTAMLKENSFYTVNVSDDANQFSGAQLPGTQYVLYGTSYMVTLPEKDGVTWEVVDKDGNAVAATQIEDEAAQEVLIQIKDIAAPIEIVTKKEGYPIVYKAGISGQLVNLGSHAPKAQQQLVNDGAIKGRQTWKDALSASDETYTLLSLDSDRVQVYANGDTNNRKYFYSFEGWKVEGTNTILPAGTELTREQLKAYGGENGPVTLTAVWKGTDTKNRVASINFFLNKKCEIMDNLSNGFQSQPKANFTNSVYATRILNTDTVPTSVKQILAPPTSADNAYTVDATLRKSVTTALDYGIKLETFPSDEVIMAQLRATNATITMDGQTVPVEDLTTDNFAVRWYVLKYEDSDGWHIDGILVAKKGRFVVKKSFAGDSTAVAEVKKNFTISVTHSESSGTVTDYTLSLNAKDEETNASRRGYDSYDAATDTYTWVLDARQNRTYTIKENNYTLDQSRWNHTNRYQVYNTKSGTESRGVWKTYDSAQGVKVTASSYATDEPVGSCQTAAFQNLYVESGVLTLYKADATTGNGLKNVAFVISRVDGESLTLYRKPGTSQYSTDTNAPNEGYTEAVSDNTMRTDAGGYIYVRLAVHSTASDFEEYYLEEIVPAGYTGARKIYVKVTDDGEILTASEVDASSEDSGWLETDETNKSMLTVKNQSRRLTSVTAEKDWGDDIAEKDRVPVTVALYRNGMRMSGSGYTQVLSSANDWRYVWADLPLYVDGEVARYSLREIMIGNTAYDPEAGEDGYRDYMVSYDSPKYRKGDDGAFGTSPIWHDIDGNLQYADQVLLVVHNGEIRGTISFTKIDADGNPLEDAEFTLYSDRECTKALETVRSAANGFVSFGNHPVGTYYMKETLAPRGYRLSDTLYRVLIRGGAATITEDGDETDTPVTRIVNQSEVSLILKKTDTKGRALTDAEFTVLKDGKNYGIYSVGNDGTVKLENLEDGRYLFTETKAPAGYQRRPEQAAVEVKNGEITFAQSDVSYEFWNLEKTENEDDCYTLTVKNEAMYELPSTGGPGIYWNFLIGTVLMCMAAAAMILWRRRERRST